MNFDLSFLYDLNSYVLKIFLLINKFNLYLLSKHCKSLVQSIIQLFCLFIFINSKYGFPIVLICKK